MQLLADRRLAPVSRLLLAIATLLLVTVAGVAWWMYATDELYLQGPRGGYFIYLAVLCGVAILLCRWPRLSASVLTLALIELCWGVGTFVFDSGDGRIRLLPDNTYTGGRFQWHPLLQEQAGFDAEALPVALIDAGARRRRRRSFQRNCLWSWWKWRSRRLCRSIVLNKGVEP